MKVDLREIAVFDNVYIGFRDDQAPMAEALSSSPLSGPVARDPWIHQMSIGFDYWMDNTLVSSADEIIGSEDGQNMFVRAMQGDDTISVNSGTLNWVTGNMGKDTFFLYASKDGREDGNIKGANDDDTINVVSGSWGESGRPINGNQGNDTLNIWTGATCTALRGGIGDDTFNIYGGIAYVHSDPGIDTFNLFDAGYVRIDDYNKAEDIINTGNLSNGWYQLLVDVVDLGPTSKKDLAIYNSADEVACVVVDHNEFF